MTGTEGMTQQRSRPAVVTIAVAATLLTALGLLGSATPTLYTEDLLDTYRRIYAGTEAEQTVAAMSAAPYYVVGGVLIGTALVLVSAALAAWAGRRLGRVVIWVLGLLVVCASVPVLVYSPDPPRPAGAPPQPVIERMLAEATPTWVDVVSTGGAVVAMVSVLAAMALFGLPRANDFFRPEPPTVATPPPLNG